MSLLLIATALLGFGYFQYAGLSTWHSPWWVHVHAFTQMGWLGLFAVQNALVVKGNVALHRKLGQLGVAYAIWLAIFAVFTGYSTLSTGRNDSVLPDEALLATNWATVGTFAILFIAAFGNRHRSDWHKRLMLCSVIALSVPSFGRILVMLGIPSTTNRALFVLSYIVIGMLFDWRVRSRVHPAYIWGAAAAVSLGLAIGGLTLFPPFVAFARGIAP
ncbi:hypothetical protein [Tsuneonella mangrovi]|uniref:hypothetical protein n=1 Tax=Tsuneonella mangrovi TaxID=1982042 RepID=UPI000BA24455|nr:hypothetical protein [Tsuneonella mangrovi]